MANVNKTIIIGRLGADPEIRTFSGGGKVAALRVCTNNRKKNKNGEWEDDPMWIDVDCFNRGDYSKMADTCENHLQKGSQVYVEGHLVLDKWTDTKTGQERQKHKIMADAIQLIDSKAQGGTSPPKREKIPSVDEPPLFPETPTKAADIPF